MFTLVTDRSKYLRIRRNVTSKEVERQYQIPVVGEVFSGRIIELKSPCKIYVAKPFDTYASISQKTGADIGELEELNGRRPVYPSRRLFVPCKK